MIMLTKQFRDHDFPDWLLDYEERTLRMFGASQSVTTQANAKRRRTKKQNRTTTNQSNTGQKRRTTIRGRSYRVAQAEISQRIDVLRDTNGSKRREYSANISIEEAKDIFNRYRNEGELEISDAELQMLKAHTSAPGHSWRKEVRQQLISLLAPLLDEHLDLAVGLAEDRRIASRIEELRKVRDDCFARKENHTFFPGVYAKAERNLRSLVISALLPYAVVLSVRTNSPVRNERRITSAFRFNPRRVQCN